MEQKKGSALSAVAPICQDLAGGQGILLSATPDLTEMYFSDTCSSMPVMMMIAPAWSMVLVFFSSSIIDENEW